MSQTLTISIALGPAFSGALARLRAQLLNTAGALVGGLVATGFAATPGTNGDFLWTYSSYPDGFRGAVQFYDTATGLPIPNLPLYSINPEELTPNPTGARSVTFHVTDGVDPVEGASVRVTKGAVSFVFPTDVDGDFTYGLDDGTYDYVVSKVGYAGAVGSVMVAGNITEPVVIIPTAVAPDPPSDLQIIGRMYTYDGSGNLKPAVPVVFQLVGGPELGGVSPFSGPFTVTSNGDAYLETALFKNAEYRARRGSGPWTNFLTGEDSPLDLPESIGFP